MEKINNELYIVFFSDSKYEYQAKGVIESALINIKSEFRLIYYTIGFDSDLEYDNLTKIRIEFIDKIKIFDFYKPHIIIDSIERFGDEKFIYVDTDILFGKRFSIDKIINNSDFPLMSSGNWNFPFIYQRGLIVDESNLMSHFNITNEMRSMTYVYACFISYNKSCYDIILEWKGLCFDDFLLSKGKYYFPLNDETSINVILWRRGISKNLGRIFLNTHRFDYIKYVEENENVYGEGGNVGLFGDDFARCENSSDIMLYHGTKDTDDINRVIEYFREKKRHI
jgi:hypothetical protein